LRRPLNPNRRHDQDVIRKDLEDYTNGNKMYPHVNITGEMPLSELPRKAKKVARALAKERNRIKEDSDHFDHQLGLALRVAPKGLSAVICTVGRNAFRLAVMDLQDPEDKKVSVGEFWRHEIGEVFPKSGIQLADGRSITLEGGNAVPHGHVDLVTVRRSNTAISMLSGVIKEDHTTGPPTVV
jgi:hypothetical protein